MHEIKELVGLGLYGKGLIVIDSPTLVKRYNRALQAINLEPTGLESFHIDGWGWSPEIAMEKENYFYLSRGLASSYGIILTPKQKGVSVYAPTNSFDKFVIGKIFDDRGDQIADLTTQTAIWFECDQGVSRFTSPEDLLSVEYVTIRFGTIDGLSEAKSRQTDLERKFYGEDDAWADQALRKSLRESYKAFGDLKNRKFLLPDLPFSDIRSFYTRSFEGIVLLRDIEGLTEPVLIHEAATLKAKEVRDQGSGYAEYNIDDPELLKYLEEKDVVGLYPDKIIGEHKDLERMLLFEILNALTDNLPDEIRPGGIDTVTAKARAYANDFLDKGWLNESYLDIEKLLKRVRDKKDLKLGSLSETSRKRLLRPNPKLPDTERRVLSKFLLRVDSFDVFRLYVYDKQRFFRHYVTWPESKRLWSREIIKRDYEDNDDFSKK